MSRRPTISNITRGGAIHINNGEGGPLCGTYDRNGGRNMPWKAARVHATCRRCMSMQRDIDAGLAAAADTATDADVPQQTRRRVGVPGLGANGTPRKKPLTSGFELPESVIDEELVGAAAAAVEEIPAPATVPALSATETKEQTDMTTIQQPATAGQEVVPAAAADVRPANSTSPLILDLGGFIQVDETKPTFMVTFGAPDQPSIVVKGIEAADKQTALVTAIKRLTFTVVQENTVAWMGGGEG